MENTMKKVKMPKVRLKPLPSGMVVNVQTVQDYRTLTRVYECGGWAWISGEAATAKDDLFERYKNKTCLRADGTILYGSIDDAWVKRGSVLSLDNFFVLEGMTPERVEEINRYFNTREA